MHSFLSKVFGRKKAEDKPASPTALAPGELLDGKFEAVSPNVSPSANFLELDANTNANGDSGKNKEVGFSKLFRPKSRISSPEVNHKKLDTLPHLSLNFRETRQEVARDLGFLLDVDSTTNDLLSDAVIGQRRLNPFEALVIIQACSKAITSRGLETLGVMHPHWYSSSADVQRRLISHFLQSLALQEAQSPASPVSLTSPTSLFESELNFTRSPHDIAAVLRWGLRHLQIEGDSFGTVDGWYKAFLDAEATADYPPKSYSEMLAPTLSAAHLDLLTATLEIFSSLAAHAETNSTSGSKLCKMFGLWLLTARRIEDKDDWFSFYSRWERTGRMLEHIFLARIRDESTDHRMPVRLLELVRKYPYTQGLSSPTTDLQLLPPPRFTTISYDALFVRIEVEFPKAELKPKSKMHPLNLLADAFSTQVTEGEHAELWTKIITASRKGSNPSPLSNIFADETIRFLSLIPDERAKRIERSPVFSIDPVSPVKKAFSESGPEQPVASSSQHRQVATEPPITPVSPIGIGSDWVQFSSSGFIDSSPAIGPLVSTLFDTDVEKTTPPAVSLSRKSSKRLRRKSSDVPRISIEDKVKEPEVPAQDIKPVVKASKLEIIQFDEAFIDFWSDSLLDPITSSWPTFIICKFKSTLSPSLVYGPFVEGQQRKTLKWLVLEQAYTVRPLAPPPTPAAAATVAAVSSSPPPTEAARPVSPSPSTKKRFNFFSRSLSGSSMTSMKARKREKAPPVGEMGELTEEENKRESKVEPSPVESSFKSEQDQKQDDKAEDKASTGSTAAVVAGAAAVTAIAAATAHAVLELEGTKDEPQAAEEKEPEVQEELTPVPDEHSAPEEVAVSEESAIAKDSETEGPSVAVLTENEEICADLAEQAAREPLTATESNEDVATATVEATNGTAPGAPSEVENGSVNLPEKETELVQQEGENTVDADEPPSPEPLSAATAKNSDPVATTHEDFASPAPAEEEQHVLEQVPAEDVPPIEDIPVATLVSEEPDITSPAVDEAAAPVVKDTPELAPTADAPIAEVLSTQDVVQAYAPTEDVKEKDIDTLPVTTEVPVETPAVADVPGNSEIAVAAEPKSAEEAVELTEVKVEDGPSEEIPLAQEGLPEVISEVASPGQEDLPEVIAESEASTVVPVDEEQLSATEAVADDALLIAQQTSSASEVAPEVFAVVGDATVADRGSEETKTDAATPLTTTEPNAVAEIGAVEETPVPAVHEVSTVEEVSATEEAPAIEEAPAAIEETPAAIEETPAATEEAPAIEEAPAAVEEAPAIEEAPAVEEAPVVEEAAAVEEAPAATEEAPAVEEVPVVVEEAATVEDAATIEEAPAAVEEAATVEEVPAAEEVSAAEETPIEHAIIQPESNPEAHIIVEEVIPVVSTTEEEVNPAAQELEVVSTAIIDIPTASHSIDKETPVSTENADAVEAIPEESTEVEILPEEANMESEVHPETITAPETNVSEPPHGNGSVIAAGEHDQERPLPKSASVPEAEIIAEAPVVINAAPVSEEEVAHEAVTEENVEDVSSQSADNIETSIEAAGRASPLQDKSDVIIPVVEETPVAEEIDVQSPLSHANGVVEPQVTADEGNEDTVLEKEGESDKEFEDQATLAAAEGDVAEASEAVDEGAPPTGFTEAIVEEVTESPLDEVVAREDAPESNVRESAEDTQLLEEVDAVSDDITEETEAGTATETIALSPGGEINEPALAQEVEAIPDDKTPDVEVPAASNHTELDSVSDVAIVFEDQPPVDDAVVTPLKREAVLDEVSPDNKLQDSSHVVAVDETETVNSLPQTEDVEEPVLLEGAPPALPSTQTEAEVASPQETDGVVTSPVEELSIEPVTAGVDNNSVTEHEDVESKVMPTVTSGTGTVEVEDDSLDSQRSVEGNETQVDNQYTHTDKLTNIPSDLDMTSTIQLDSLASSPSVPANAALLSLITELNPSTGDIPSTLDHGHADLSEHDGDDQGPPQIRLDENPPISVPETSDTTHLGLGNVSADVSPLVHDEARTGTDIPDETTGGQSEALPTTPGSEAHDLNSNSTLEVTTSVPFEGQQPTESDFTGAEAAVQVLLQTGSARDEVAIDESNIPSNDQTNDEEAPTTEDSILSEPPAMGPNELTPPREQLVENAPDETGSSVVDNSNDTSAKEEPNTLDVDKETTEEHIDSAEEHVNATHMVEANAIQTQEIEGDDLTASTSEPSEPTGNHSDAGVLQDADQGPQDHEKVVDSSSQAVEHAPVETTADDETTSNDNSTSHVAEESKRLPDDTVNSGDETSSEVSIPVPNTLTEIVDAVADTPMEPVDSTKDDSGAIHTEVEDRVHPVSLDLTQVPIDDRDEIMADLPTEPQNETLLVTSESDVDNTEQIAVGQSVDPSNDDDAEQVLDDVAEPQVVVSETSQLPNDPEIDVAVAGLKDAEIEVSQGAVTSTEVASEQVIPEPVGEVPSIALEHNIEPTSANGETEETSDRIAELVSSEVPNSANHLTADPVEELGATSGDVQDSVDSVSLENAYDTVDEPLAETSYVQDELESPSDDSEEIQQPTEELLRSQTPLQEPEITRVQVSNSLEASDDQSISSNADTERFTGDSDTSQGGLDAVVEPNEQGDLVAETALAQEASPPPISTELDSIPDSNAPELASSELATESKIGQSDAFERSTHTDHGSEDVDSFHLQADDQHIPALTTEISPASEVTVDSQAQPSHSEQPTPLTADEAPKHSADLVDPTLTTVPGVPYVAEAIPQPTPLSESTEESQSSAAEPVSFVITEALVGEQPQILNESVDATNTALAIEPSVPGPVIDSTDQEVGHREDILDDEPSEISVQQEPLQQESTMSDNDASTVIPEEPAMETLQEPNPVIPASPSPEVSPEEPVTPINEQPYPEQDSNESSHVQEPTQSTLGDTDEPGPEVSATRESQDSPATDELIPQADNSEHLLVGEEPTPEISVAADVVSSEDVPTDTQQATVEPSDHEELAQEQDPHSVPTPEELSVTTNDEAMPTVELTGSAVESAQLPADREELRADSNIAAETADKDEIIIDESSVDVEVAQTPEQHDHNISDEPIISQAGDAEPVILDVETHVDAASPAPEGPSQVETGFTAQEHESEVVHEDHKDVEMQEDAADAAMGATAEDVTLSSEERQGVPDIQRLEIPDIMHRSVSETMNSAFLSAWSDDATQISSPLSPSTLVEMGTRGDLSSKIEDLLANSGEKEHGALDGIVTSETEELDANVTKDNGGVLLN